MADDEVADDEVADDEVADDEVADDEAIDSVAVTDRPRSAPLLRLSNSPPAPRSGQVVDSDASSGSPP